MFHRLLNLLPLQLLPFSACSSSTLIITICIKGINYSNIIFSDCDKTGKRPTSLSFSLAFTLSLSFFLFLFLFFYFWLISFFLLLLCIVFSRWEKKGKKVVLQKNKKGDWSLRWMMIKCFLNTFGSFF